MFSASELILIRHAAADTNGRLCGRTDVGLAPGHAAAFAARSGVFPDMDEVLVSPAVRCKLTAEGLWPKARQVPDDRLWEQDFGAWEGQPYADIPDLGEVSRTELAEVSAPGGESFADLCARVAPALMEFADRARTGEVVVVVAHAGVVRAGLGLALDDMAAGLAFQVDPLSITRLTCLTGGGFAIKAVNLSPA